MPQVFGQPRSVECKQIFFRKIDMIVEPQSHQPQVRMKVRDKRRRRGMSRYSSYHACMPCFLGTKT